MPEMPIDRPRYPDKDLVQEVSNVISKLVTEKNKLATEHDIQSNIRAFRDTVEHRARLEEVLKFLMSNGLIYKYNLSVPHEHGEDYCDHEYEGYRPAQAGDPVVVSGTRISREWIVS